MPDQPKTPTTQTDRLGHKWPLLGRHDLKPDGSMDAACLLCGAVISATSNHIGPDGFPRSKLHKVDPAVKLPCKGQRNG